MFRARVPAAAAQQWLAWLNSTFSQDGAFSPAPLNRFILLFCHFAAATPNPRAAIALGAESLEVTQQLDDSSATTSADVVVVDATVSFVGQQDYVAAAAQLDALLKVQHAVCVSCL